MEYIQGVVTPIPRAAATGGFFLCDEREARLMANWVNINFISILRPSSAVIGGGNTALI